MSVLSGQDATAVTPAQPGPPATGSMIRSTREQRVLVGQLVEQLEPRLPELGQRFFQKLMAEAPEVDAALKGSRAFRQRKFINLVLTFRSVKYLERLGPVFVEMGRRHRRYHRHFHAFLPVTERCLREVFAEACGSAWTKERQEAWRVVYADVAGLMGQAGESETEERRRTQALIRSGHERRAGWAVRTDEGLLEAVGGEPVVRQVHQVFYEALFNDPWLGQFFSGRSPQMLIDKQTEFMVSAFGGPHAYRGATPAIVHMHMDITEEQADLRERYLRWAIGSQGISEFLAERWLAVDRLFRPGIVKSDATACVLLCVGQVPLKAIKPAGYQEPDFVRSVAA